MNETAYATSYSMHCRTRSRTSWSRMFIETNTSLLATSDDRELLHFISPINCRVNDAVKKHNRKSNYKHKMNSGSPISDGLLISNSFEAEQCIRDTISGIIRCIYRGMYESSQPRVLLKNMNFRI